MSKPKLKIDLRGPDGNIYVVIGKVKTALVKAGQTVEAKEFSKQAFEQGSYENVLAFCQKYVDVTFKR